jgi:integrase/recombinase XerD
LNHEEIAAILHSPTESEHPRGLRDRAILAFLYATGFRAAEVVDLKLEDVDLSQGIVFRPATQNRSVPLGLAQGSMLDYLRKGRPQLVRDPHVQALFLNQRGQPLSRQGLWLVVKRWAKAAGVKGRVSPQTLRHTVAQNLLEEGKSRKEVLEFLDLSSPNSLWFGRADKQSN